MNDIYLSEITEIIYCTILFPDISIQELAEKTSIPVDTARSIMLYLYEYPFGGIEISYRGISGKRDIYEMDEELLDRLVEWSIDTSRMQKVPVENLDEDEALIMSGLLQGIEAVEADKLITSLCKRTRKSMMLTKGINQNAWEFRKLKHYPFIREAVLERKAISTKYDNDNKSRILCPLGIIFHSEEDSWYLICKDKGESIYPYEISKFSEMQLDAPFVYPEGFKMDEYLRKYFGMEMEKEEYVRVIFKDEANVIEKAKRRLEDKGVFNKLEDGAEEFTGCLAGLEDFRKWILGFGSSVLVKEPVWLKEDVIGTYRYIAANYGNMEKFLELVHGKDIP